MASLSGHLARRVNSWLPAALLRPLLRPAALFFHGVETQISDPQMQEMHHSADAFRVIAKTLRDDFQVLPLSQIDDVLAHPERHSRSLFLKSDDGYRNTLTVAADILREFGLPWTLFVSTHHIDSGERNPVHLIRLFFRYAPAGVYRVPHFSDPIILAADDTRLSTAKKWIEHWKLLSYGQAQEVLEALYETIPSPEQDQFKSRYDSERFLNWDEVAALKACGVEIGAHAHWHWPMNHTQPDADLYHQARLSRARIIEKLGTCRFFAYPFGTPRDVSTRAWRHIRDAGYSHAFSTVAGNLDAGCNPWLLPRYGLALSEPNLTSMVALLGGNNRRLRRWQGDMVKPIQPVQHVAVPR